MSIAMLGIFSGLIRPRSSKRLSRNHELPPIFERPDSPAGLGGSKNREPLTALRLTKTPEYENDPAGLSILDKWFEVGERRCRERKRPSSTEELLEGPASPSPQVLEFARSRHHIDSRSTVGQRVSYLSIYSSDNAF